MLKLFDEIKPDASLAAPLAEQLRPKTLEELIGQEHLAGSQTLLKAWLDQGECPSLILWGPPGCGKTTLARLIAAKVKTPFIQLSAVMSGVADLRKVFAECEKYQAKGQKPLVFIDEIHHFNRSQQDSLLPYVEQGTFTLLGATTENPSFDLNSALLSRCQVLVLKPLTHEALQLILKMSEQKLAITLPLDDTARAWLIEWAEGDARALINSLELVLKVGEGKRLTSEELAILIQKRLPLYDKNRDGHYNLISALHKSVRGSDPDAALYWFMRMVEGGENLRFLARRLIRMACEDIGLADPQALTQAMAASQAYEFLGSPEGDLALAQAVIYMTTAPKSNAIYTAYKKAKESAQKTASLMPPAAILNAPTKMMKEQGYGAGYIYDHDTPEGFSGQNYFPDAIKRPHFYSPYERGFERDIQKRLEYWQRLRKTKSQQ